MVNVNPEEVVWLNNYYREGLVHMKGGRLVVAEEIFVSILAVLPLHLGARFQLGCVYMMTGNFEAAAREFTRITTDFPDHAESYTNLGSCYLELGRLPAAHGAYEAALALDANDTQALFNLGVIQRAMGHLEAAMATYQHLLTIDPAYVDAHVNLGAIHTLLRQPEAAISHYREANYLRPNDAVILHALMAAKGDPSVTAMAPAYARALFDGAAVSYDQQLIQALHYQVPARLAEALDELQISGARVLDLGCGTGLCGEVLRSVARLLVGVDVSPKMLAVARAKGVYDTLHEADIGDYLTSVTDAFDLIVAGDVFVYSGELRSVLLGCYQALSHQGLLVFTVEVGESGGRAYALQDTGRFWHDVEALLGLARECGFRVLSQTTIILREQAGVPVQGCLFVCQNMLNLNKIDD